MVKNEDEGNYWKNIPIARQAFDLMKTLPDILHGEFETPAEKAVLLGQMLNQTTETKSPRFSLEVRRYMQQLDPDNEENLKGIAKLEDFLNPEFPMEDYCKKYRVHLLFDPVERSEEWESVIYEVEKALDRKFRLVPRRMGFCFGYWMAKEKELAKRGIDWSNPHIMNPRVIFD